VQQVGDVGPGQHGAELGRELLRVLCGRQLANGDRPARVVGEKLDPLTVLAGDAIVDRAGTASDLGGDQGKKQPPGHTRRQT